MRKEDCFRIGHISRTYSFRGELIFQIEDHNPQRFDELESVFVEIHDKLVPFFIEHIRFDRQGPFARVKLEGVNDEATAKPMVKQPLYVPQHLFEKETPDPTKNPELLLGYKVVDIKAGSLGEVIDFIDHVANPVIQVEGEKGEVLIPIQPEFILEIEEDQKVIRVELPDGLIGLNA